MKRKNILLAASLFGSVAIVSTGFAAWVITGNATQTAQGTVTVDTVKDERYSFTASVAEDEKIQFGTDNSYSVKSSDWLKNNAPVVEDDLKAVVNITNFKKGDVATSISDKNLEATLSIQDSGKNTVLTTLKSQGYLSYGFAITSTEAGVGTVTLTFNWGSALGGKNPIEYFNTTYATYDTELTNPVTVGETALTTSNTAADYALALLTELYKLNSATFVVTLKTK